LMLEAIRLGPLGRRLAAAFLAVALVALAAFFVLTILAEHFDVSSLAGSQRTEAINAIVSSAASAYRANGGWSGADLQPVVALADLTSGATELSTTAGTVLLRTGDAALLHSGNAVQVTRTVDADNATVGRLLIAFPAGGLTRPEQRLRTDLAEAAALSALVAVLVAFAASVGLGRIVIGPIRRLSTAAHAIGAGDRRVRIGAAGPGELAELGQAFDAMVVALDETERSRLALIAEVAHELRTPVAVLQAETEALVDGVRLPTPAALASLHDETLRLGRRIEDLQTLASADATGLALERSAVDLGRVAAESAELLGSQFDAAGVALDLAVEPTEVWGDSHRLHQVVTNLLTNACKYAPSGGTVRVEVRPLPRRGHLSVTDDGPGIAPSERLLVFERFYRGETAKRTTGSGIGLTVVQRIVDAHGGRVRIEDPPTGGTSFVVELPSVDPGPTGISTQSPHSLHL
jgi:two-component system, OmpR family, sensor histidine kinase BaeS